MQLKKRTKLLVAAAAVAIGTLTMTVAATAAVSCFTDVDTSDWFEVYVCEAADAGIVTGYPDGTFDPDGTITRAEAAVIATRQLEESIGHGAIVVVTDGSDMAPYAGYEPSDIGYYGGGAAATADGYVTIPISAPVKLDGVQYGLKSVTVCIDYASGSAAIGQMVLWQSYGGGNIGSTPGPLSSGCATIPSGAPANRGVGVVIELTSPNAADRVAIDYVESVWVPVDDLVITSTVDDSATQATD